MEKLTFYKIPHFLWSRLIFTLILKKITQNVFLLQDKNWLTKIGYLVLKIEIYLCTFGLNLGVFCNIF